MRSILDPSNLQRTAKEDINGLLYFHIRTQLEQSCRHIQSSSRIHFVLYCGGAATLPHALDAQVLYSRFDRIEVSNIVDEAYLGVHKTLATFGPLVKHTSVNPHASLIALFLNACEIADRVMGNDRNEAILKKQMEQVIKYTHYDSRDIVNPTSTTMFKFIAAKDLVRDYDKIFQYYMAGVNFSIAVANAGLQMRERQTIVEAWPMRLRKKPGELGAAEEFDELMASSCTGAERYFEWSERSSIPVHRSGRFEGHRMTLSPGRSREILVISHDFVNGVMQVSSSMVMTIS